MVLPKISDRAKGWIFFGAALLWIAWGVVNYLFDYDIQIFLGVLVLVLVVWIWAVVKKTTLR